MLIIYTATDSRREWETFRARCGSNTVKERLKWTRSGKYCQDPEMQIWMIVVLEALCWLLLCFQVVTKHLVHFGTRAHKDTWSTRLNVEKEGGGSAALKIVSFLGPKIQWFVDVSWLARWREEKRVDEKNERKTTPTNRKLQPSTVSKRNGLIMRKLPGYQLIERQGNPL